MASSSSLSADAGASQTSTCSGSNSSGHNYSYGKSVSSANGSGSGGSGDGTSSYSASWTGAADASASVLRRNGIVVATNYATNPMWLNQGAMWTSNAYTLTHDTSGFTTLSVPKSDGEWNAVFVTPTQRDWNPASSPWNAPKTTYYLIVGYDNAKNVTTNNFVMECGDDAGCSSGYLSGSDDSSTGIRYFKVVPSPANSQMPMRIDLRSDPDTANAATLRLKNAAVVTASDYAAMQSAGISWFDGDGNAA